MDKSDVAGVATVSAVVILIALLVISLIWVAPVLGQRNARMSAESKQYAVRKAALQMCQNQIKGGVLTDRCIELAKVKS